MFLFKGFLSFVVESISYSSQGSTHVRRIFTETKRVIRIRIDLFAKAGAQKPK